MNAIADTLVDEGLALGKAQALVTLLDGYLFEKGADASPDIVIPVVGMIGEALEEVREMNGDAQELALHTETKEPATVAHKTLRRKVVKRK